MQGLQKTNQPTKCSWFLLNPYVLLQHINKNYEQAQAATGRNTCLGLILARFLGDCPSCKSGTPCFLLFLFIELSLWEPIMAAINDCRLPLGIDLDMYLAASFLFTSFLALSIDFFAAAFLSTTFRWSSGIRYFASEIFHSMM